MFEPRLDWKRPALSTHVVSSSLPSSSSCSVIIWLGFLKMNCKKLQQNLCDTKLVTWLHIHTLLILLSWFCSFTSFLASNKPVVFFYFVCCVFVLSFLPSISRYLYADPLHSNMTYLLLRLLKDDLKEYTYAARLAGLVYGVASGMNALLVSKPCALGEGGVWALVTGRSGFISVWLCDVSHL